MLKKKTCLFQVRHKVQLKKATHFFLFPQVDFHAVHRYHNVDFFLLDVFHLELILQREDRQRDRQLLIFGGTKFDSDTHAASEIFEAESV